MILHRFFVYFSLSVSATIIPASFTFALTCEEPLQASQIQETAYFGSAIATDGERVVIGARGANNHHGAAYVFRREGLRWIEEQILIGSASQGNSYFGSAVAIDGNIIVVGAYQYDGPALNTGAAYIFELDGSQWSEKIQLQPQSANQSASFGIAVAVDGTTVVVGAERQTQQNEQNGGAAYVYVKKGAQWNPTPTQTLEDSDPLPDAGSFGSSVAIRGNTIVVGEKNDKEMGANAGAAHVFTRDENDETYYHTKKLLAPDADGNSLFGAAVAIDGSVLVVGAEQHDVEISPNQFITDAGQAYVFSLINGMQWVPSAILRSSIPQQQGFFGTSVAVSGKQSLVGARGEFENSGAAYNYKLITGAWTLQSQILASDQELGDRFGRSVALHSSTFFIGAPEAETDLDVSSSGIVYRYRPFRSFDMDACLGTAAAGVP